MKRIAGILVLIAVAAVLLIPASIQFRRARTFTSELEAESHIRLIHAAQARFHDETGRYAGSLAELGIAGTTDGYKFALTAARTGYSISAGPKVFNSTGRRTFFSDQTGAIHQNWGAQAADAKSPELN